MTGMRSPRGDAGWAVGRGRPGFTVMEVLVTAGVAVLILSALYLLLERNVTLYGQGEAKADVQQGVRVVLDEMSVNLRAAGNGVPRRTQIGTPGRIYYFYNGPTVGTVDLLTNATAVTFLGDIDGTAAQLAQNFNPGDASVRIATACIVPVPPTGDDCRNYNSNVSLTGERNTVVVGSGPDWAFGRYIDSLCPQDPPCRHPTLQVEALSYPSGGPASFTAATSPTSPPVVVAALEVVKYALLQGIDFRGLPCQPSCLVRLIGLYGGQASATAPTICWSSRTCQPEPETLLDNVVGLQFTYFDANNVAVNPVPNPGAHDLDARPIRRLQIRLQVRAGKGLPDAIHSVDVRLRTL